MTLMFSCLDANRKHVAYGLLDINATLHNSALSFNHVRPLSSSLELAPLHPHPAPHRPKTNPTHPQSRAEDV